MKANLCESVFRCGAETCHDQADCLWYKPDPYGVNEEHGFTWCIHTNQVDDISYCECKEAHSALNISASAYLLQG